jgi:hypothetical protein
LSKSSAAPGKKGGGNWSSVSNGVSMSTEVVPPVNASDCDVSDGWTEGVAGKQLMFYENVAKVYKLFI